MKGQKRPRTILFLIADTGAGHRSAANAIRAAIEEIEEQTSLHLPPSRRPPPTRVVIVDAFAECGRFPLRNGVFLYGPAIKYSPRLYGQIFRATNSSERFDTARRLAQPFLRQGLRRLIERVRPDVIVSIHPLLNHVTLSALRDIGVRVPFVTVVTDLVSIHCAWLARGVDACIVPTEEARIAALDAGIATSKVHLLGMPISPAFAHPPDRDRSAVREQLGLDVNRPVILVVGGGEGAGGLYFAVEALAYATLNAQLAIITGRNKHLRAELEARKTEFSTPAQIFGFVHNMPDFMRAADIIVTKAGPGTICEAFACGLPVVLTGAIPGQEEGNINWVLDHQAGTIATTPEDLVAAVRSLLDVHNPALAQMRENALRLSYAHASRAIASHILSLVPPGRSASTWRGHATRSHGARRPAIRQRPHIPVPQVSLMAVASLRRRKGSHGHRAGMRVPVNMGGTRVLGLANLGRVRALLRGNHGETI